MYGVEREMCAGAVRFFAALCALPPAGSAAKNPDFF